MGNLLFLAHRLPFPPNKGDKVRSYNLLRYLAARHRVFLGTFVDDPDDEQHVPAVRKLCAEVHAPRLHPRRARIGSLQGLLRAEPLTLSYYRDASMTRWVQRMLAHEPMDAALVFSSSMAQYAASFPGPVLMDFVDVDSAKWTGYASTHRWPLSWIYGREGRTLLAYEREVAANASHSFFASEREATLFRGLAPESANRVGALGMGVDAEFFSVDAVRVCPFAADEIPIVFTGAMDYWPNIDAVCWFVREVLPQLRQRRPSLRFHIVGRAPTAVVRALESESVSVTGTVPDVRPYLQHAAVVVVPLRLARGVQSKVLEAMAMARPVVAAAACVESIDVTPGEHLVSAADAADYVEAVDTLLREPARAIAIGNAGRARVLEAYSWEAQLRSLDSHLTHLHAPGLAA